MQFPGDRPRRLQQQCRFLARPGVDPDGQPVRGSHSQALSFLQVMLPKGALRQRSLLPARPDTGPHPQHFPPEHLVGPVPGQAGYPSNEVDGERMSAVGKRFRHANRTVSWLQKINKKTQN